MTGHDKRGSDANSQRDENLDSSDPGKTSPDESDRADTSRTSQPLEETQNFDSSGALRDSQEQGETPQSFGRYQVRRLLGRGGFGAVYVGFDPVLNRQVAIKIPHLRDDVGDLEEAFLNEAQRLAQLRHQGIVAIHDVGVESGRCFIVSEYLEGQGLSGWLKKTKPTWQQSADIVASIADALAHAHAQSTIHRDVKPDNIVVVEEGGAFLPKLLDFGLAISESHAVGDQRGTLAGTPAYMSPEQARGLAHRIDGRTDIFSLGVVLYELLCGRRPFRSKDVVELLRQIREDSPQPPRQLAQSIPSALEDICLKAMAKSESARYKTAGDMASDLRTVLQNASSPVAKSTAPAEEFQGGGDSSSNMSASTIRRMRDAERRQLTVMICNCDASDPEQSIAALDAEDQQDLLEAFHHLCEDVIRRLDGTIAQSTGQELLVSFGFPIAYEDAPQRAIRAGLEIIHQLERLNADLQKQQKLQLSVWAAIHTGMAVAGIGESADTLSIIGDARNVADKLENLVDPGQLIISEATHQLVKGFFVCESRGTHKLRGLPNPIETFQVLEEGKARSRLELSDPANLTPLIGRDMELGIIKDRWEHAEDGMGQVVLLIGDAGLGKSRLVREIKDHVAGAETGTASTDAASPVIEWRCAAYHATSSLYPATDFFERLLGFSRTDSPSQKLDILVRHLQSFNLDSPEKVALFASLLSIPPDDRCAPIELAPIRQKERTQALILEWLQEYASRQPVLFIVEDLHWIDPSTLELLALYMEQGLSDSVLTLLTFRPEFRTPWQSYGHQTQVALTRLTKRQIGEMMKRKISVDEIPLEIVAQVAERTDGVPLFVEEFAQVVHESGVLRDGAESQDISQALSSIPSSLQDLLAARLDRMASNPDVVQLGAAFGRGFTYELFSAATDLDAEQLHAELAKLVEAEVLLQKGRPPNSSYIFKHALIQDAAYNSLLKKKRHQFHQTIAETLERGFAETAETQPELLANHFSKSGEIGKAIEYWLKAGQRAQSRCAVAEAMSHLQQGLDLIACMEEGPQRDQMELGFQLPMGAVLLQAKGYANEDVGKTFSRARELCERLGPGAPLFHVIWGFWVWNVVLNRLEMCLGFANEMVELAEQTQDDGFIMEARFCLGMSLMYVGKPTEARTHLEHGFELYDEDRCRFHSQFTGQICGPILLSYLGITLWQLGFPDQALHIGRKGVDLAKQLGHSFSESFSQYHMGWLAYYYRSRETIANCGREGHAIAHEGGFAIWESLGTLNQAVGKLLQDGLSTQEAEEAMQKAHGGLAQFTATGANLHITHCTALFADLYMNMGKLDEAAEEVEKGFAASEKYSEVCDLAELHRLNGEILLRQSTQDQSAAEACFQAAIETAQQQNAKSWELRAATSLSRLRQRQGKDEQARMLLSEVYGWFTEGFETADLLEAKALLDQLSDR